MVLTNLLFINMSINSTLILPILLLTMVILVMLGLMFTNYRVIMRYFLLGVAYWMFVESLYWVISLSLPSLAMVNSYVLSLMLSLLPAVIFLLLRPTSDVNVKYQKPQSKILIDAGHRPFSLEKDTNFHQHCIRHTSVTEKRY